MEFIGQQPVQKCVLQDVMAAEAVSNLTGWKKVRAQTALQKPMSVTVCWYGAARRAVADKPSCARFLKKSFNTEEEVVMDLANLTIEDIENTTPIDDDDFYYIVWQSEPHIREIGSIYAKAVEMGMEIDVAHFIMQIFRDGTDMMDRGELNKAHDAGNDEAVHEWYREAVAKGFHFFKTNIEKDYADSNRELMEIKYKLIGRMQAAHGK
jgi:hypothetical protein